MSHYHAPDSEPILEARMSNEQAARFVEQVNQALASVWPAPNSTVYVTHNGRRYYRAVNGEFEGDLPGATSVLKILGLATEGLIRWSANEERKAVLLAADEVYRSGLKCSDFPAAVEGVLGKARAHSKLLSKAGDLGVQVHKAIHDFLVARLAEGPTQFDDLLAMVSIDSALPASPQAQTAFKEWLAWWAASGLTPVRMEQTVWDVDLGYAGTIDLIAQAPDGMLEVWDWKSGKAIYDEYHLQVAAYCHAARNWAPVRPGGIVRLPKYASDPGLEVKQLGELYGDKRKSEGELMDAFKGALDVFKVLA